MKSESMLAVLAFMISCFTFTQLINLSHEVEHTAQSVDIKLTAHDINLNHVRLSSLPLGE